MPSCPSSDMLLFFSGGLPPSFGHPFKLLAVEGGEPFATGAFCQGVGDGPPYPGGCGIDALGGCGHWCNRLSNAALSPPGGSFIIKNRQARS